MVAEAALADIELAEPGVLWVKVKVLCAEVVEVSMVGPGIGEVAPDAVGFEVSEELAVVAGPAADAHDRAVDRRGSSAAAPFEGFGCQPICFGPSCHQ